MPPSRNRNARDIGWQYHAAMTHAPGRHSPLDGLRAVAAVAVLLTHAAIYSGLASAGGDTARYAQRLEVGVAVFFVISGFVLYRPFVSARLDGRPLPLLGRFAGRRALRIVPAYWLALTVSAVALGLAGVLSLSGFFTYYGFGQIYSQSTMTGGLVQAWTLCVEVTFYAFLPLWAWLLRRIRAPTERTAILRREALALVALAVASLAWKAAFAWSGSPERVVDSPWLHSLPAYLDQFALGMGLAVLTLWRPLSPKLIPAAGIVLAAVAFWAVSVRIGIGYALFEPYTRWQYLGRHVLYAAVGLGLVVAAVSAVPGRGLAGRALANAPVRFLGTISFGIYLWHVSVLEVLKRTGVLGALDWHPFLLGAALTLALSSAVAAASWYALERPLLRAGSRPWRRAPAVVPAPPPRSPDRPAEQPRV
jgi:peptidoglycan/LPS O-acetylase OafA/YrhL